MSIVVTFDEAEANFSMLIERVRLGEEIIITKSGEPIVKPEPVIANPTTRKPGSARGMIVLSEDFDAPLPDNLTAAFSSKTK